MAQVALITGASSGFGRMVAGELSAAGLTAYASMRDIGGKNKKTVDEIAGEAKDKGLDLRTIELDVQDEASVEAATGAILGEHGRIDVVVHNAGHMVWGPLEAFTPDQLAQLYDINVLGTQRVNRAMLPHMRQARSGLLVWISSTSVMGGIPPLLGPYFAAKAGMDQLAVAYARELAPLGIETAIVVPGATPRAPTISPTPATQTTRNAPTRTRPPGPMASPIACRRRSPRQTRRTPTRQKSAVQWRPSSTLPSGNGRSARSSTQPRTALRSHSRRRPDTRAVPAPDRFRGAAVSERRAVACMPPASPMSGDRSGSRLVFPGLARFYAHVEPVGYALLRVWLGLTILTHGVPKLLGLPHGGSPDAYANLVQVIGGKLHLPGADALAMLVTPVETLGALS